MRPNPKVAAQADEIFDESSDDEQERPLPGAADPPHALSPFPAPAPFDESSDDEQAADPPHAQSAEGPVEGGAGAGKGESGGGFGGVT
jgi:hypothetical protein